MKKVFISQPMRGKSNEEILKEREEAVKKVEEYLGEPVEVIDSFFQYDIPGATPLWLLGESIQLLSEADMAYFAKGWYDASGCKIEHECALEYGITIMADNSYDNDAMNHCHD